MNLVMSINSGTALLQHLRHDYSLPSDQECLEQLGVHAHQPSYHSSGNVDPLRRDDNLGQSNASIFSLSSNNYLQDRSVTSTDHERYHSSATNFAAAGDSSGSISTSPSSATSSLVYATGYPYTTYTAPVAPVQHFVPQSGLSGRILDDPTQQGALAAAWRSPALGHPLSPSTTNITTRDSYIHTSALPTPNHLSSPQASTYAGYPETPRSLLSGIGPPLSPSSNPLLSAQMASLSTTGYGTHRNESQNFPWVQHEGLQNLECENQEVIPRIHAKMEKGFFLSPDRSWTCYRRNYFSVTCSFELSPHIGNGRLFLNGKKVQATGMRLAAAIDGQQGKAVELIQHTPKRDRGPKNAIPIIKISPTPPNGRPAESTLSPHGVYHVPMSSFHATGVPTGPQLPLQNVRDDTPPSSRGTSPTGRRQDHAYSFGHLGSSQLPMPGQNIQHTFERVQFKSATANNGKRRASQQYFHLMVELYVDVRKEGTDKPDWVRIAYTISDKVVVRGRSPSHYKAENQGGGSSSTGRGGSTGASYASAGASYGSMSRGSFSGPGYATGPSNTGGFRASQQYTAATSPEQGYSSSTSSEPVDVKHPLEAEPTQDEDIAMQDFEGYQYVPNTLYDGTSVQSKVESPGSLPGVSQISDKKCPIREEYPEAMPGSQWSLGNCSRFQGVESSRGYYPAFSTGY